MTGRLHNNWDDCVFHVDYRTGLTQDWVLGRVATVVGTVNMQPGSAGICLNFPDGTGYLTYGTDYTGFPDGGNSRTICGLVDFQIVGIYRGIFGYGDNVAWQNFSLSTAGTGYTNKLAGLFRTGGIVSIGPNNLMEYYPKRSIYIIISYDGVTGDLKLFVNGIDQGTPGNTLSVNTNLVDPIVVGRALSGARWDGNIYTATLFDRLLSDEEVRVHTEEIMNNPRTLMSGR